MCCSGYTVLTVHPELPGQSREASIPNSEQDRWRSSPARIDRLA